MFAVVKTGGKQYKVAKGDQITVEKLAVEVGANITLDEVLTIGGDNPQIGAPTVAGASVEAEVIEQSKADKIIIFKKKRRQNYRRKLGHRQRQTVLQITDILVDGKKTAAKPAAEKKTAEPKAEPAAEKAPAKEAPAKKAAATTTEKKAAPKKTAAKKADKE